MIKKHDIKKLRQKYTQQVKDCYSAETKRDLCNDIVDNLLFTHATTSNNNNATDDLVQKISDIEDAASKFFNEMADNPSSWSTGEEAVEKFQPELDALMTEYDRVFPEYIKYPLLKDFAKNICKIHKSNMIENLNILARQNAQLNAEVQKIESRKSEKGEKTKVFGKIRRRKKSA